jgi:hypothetical protein
MARISKAKVLIQADQTKKDHDREDGQIGSPCPKCGQDWPCDAYSLASLVVARWWQTPR